MDIVKVKERLIRFYAQSLALDFSSSYYGSIRRNNEKGFLPKSPGYEKKKPDPPDTAGAMYRTGFEAACSMIFGDEFCDEMHIAAIKKRNKTMGWPDNFGMNMTIEEEAALLLRSVG